MTGPKMNWAKARLHGRATFDHRLEFQSSLPDRADRWLRAVEHRRQERPNTAPSRRTKIKSPDRNHLPAKAPRPIHVACTEPPDQP